MEDEREHNGNPNKKIKWNGDVQCNMDKEIINIIQNEIN
jgi:hypothetical protein